MKKRVRLSEEEAIVLGVEVKEIEKRAKNNNVFNNFIIIIFKIRQWGL